jgi:4-amino-4-deoxy-L-arabinose transferase-like glycosyltransferase
MKSPAFGGASGGASASRRRPALGWRLAAAAVILATAAVTLHRLGASEVCGANEAIEGIFVQQMVEHGVLLFPMENGNSPMYKPPLFHWTATALDRIAGARKVTAFNLRLPSALYAIAGVALTVGFAWTQLGEAGAILAGLILAASYQYVTEGRTGRVDMTLCFFETLALMSFLWILPATRAAPSEAAAVGQAKPNAAMSPGRIALRYVFALALGLGVLAKGPVAIILPLGAIGLFMLRERRLGELWDLFTPGSMFVGIVASLGWYVACAVGQRYGFLSRQLASENIGRFFGALGSMPPWYYVKPLLLNSLPFSLFVPFAVAAALWPRSVAGHIEAGAAPLDPRRVRERSNASPEARFAARMLATFWVVTVVFFSIAAYKRRAYLLPLWPAAAFMLAWGAGLLVRRGGVGRYARGALGAACVVMVAFNFFFLPHHEQTECAGGSYAAAAEHINRVVGRVEPLYTYGFEEDPAPLLFYLDRNAPLIRGKLGNAPPGYVIIPGQVWVRDRGQALDLTPVLTVHAGGDEFLLLRHGPALASAGTCAALNQSEKSPCKRNCFPGTDNDQFRVGRFVSLQLQRCPPQCTGFC